jgi:hypothetical protein
MRINEMMKKIAVMLLLMVSTNVFAEWTKVNAKLSIENVTLYVDIKLKTRGKKVKMWQLVDYKTPQGENRFLSVAKQDEYDCEELTTRNLVSSTYSGNMMGGNELSYHDTKKWSEPETIRESNINYKLFNIACDYNQ